MSNVDEFGNELDTFLTVELLIKRDNKAFMIRRHNTGYMDGHYAFVGGHVEKGETLRKAMVREAFEECGIKVNEEDLKLLCIIRNGKRNQYTNIFFVTDKFEGEPYNAEPEECDDTIWVDMDSLPENTIPNEKRAIYNYKNNIILDEYNF